MGWPGDNLLIDGLVSPYVISTAQLGIRASKKAKRANKKQTLDLLILTVLATTTSELGAT